MLLVCRFSAFLDIRSASFPGILLFSTLCSLFGFCLRRRFASDTRRIFLGKRQVLAVQKILLAASVDSEMHLPRAASIFLRHTGFVKGQR